MHQLATRKIIASKAMCLTGPMETEADRQYLAWVAARLGIPVADREAAWLWRADGLIVIAGWEDDCDARCDVQVAEASALLVHRLTDHRAAPPNVARIA